MYSDDRELTELRTGRPQHQQHQQQVHTCTHQRSNTRAQCRLQMVNDCRHPAAAILPKQMNLSREIKSELACKIILCCELTDKCYELTLNHNVPLRGSSPAWRSGQEKKIERSGVTCKNYFNGSLYSPSIIYNKHENALGICQHVIGFSYLAWSFHRSMLLRGQSIPPRALSSWVTPLAMQFYRSKSYETLVSRGTSSVSPCLTSRPQSYAA